MSEGKRPGGLTVMAVLNFVFAGLGVIGLLGMIAVFAMLDKIPDNNMQEAQKAQIQAYREMGPAMRITSLALVAVSPILLLLSGIGYLKQKKGLGRYGGTLYALVAIAESVIFGLLIKSGPEGGFSIGTLIGLIYPVLTLILVNTTFRDDLTN
jgi:hypothetical protein